MADPEDTRAGAGAAARGRAPTIITVAERAGVSKSVVSRVLTGEGSVSPDTRRRVLAAAEELGYVVNAVARTMVARRTHTLGAFVRDVSTPFYGHLLTAMQDAAAERGYRVVTATGSGRFAVEDERRALETLVQLRVEGLLVCSGLLPVEAVMPMARRVPLVIAGRPETSPVISSVYCDEEAGGAALADHLADLGHRRVAVMLHPARHSMTLAPRSAAMARRLRDRGVDVLDVIARTGLEAPDTLRALDEVVAAGDVTALMAPSDRYAFSALEGARRRGIRVPEDLSVTGYDGIVPYTTPLIGLTTWQQPLAAIGRLAVEALVAQLDGTADVAVGGVVGAPAAPSHVALDGRLLPGRTAAPV